MIRARMSFGQITKSYTFTAEELAEREAAGKPKLYQEDRLIGWDEAIELAEEMKATGHWACITCKFWAVYTPNPKNPNFTWSQATPNGQVSLVINNPDALRDLKAMCDEMNEEKRAHEFYVDFYPAPKED